MCVRGGSDADVQDVHCCTCALPAGAPTSLGTSDTPEFMAMGRGFREGTVAGERLGWLDRGTSYGQGVNKY